MAGDMKDLEKTRRFIAQVLRKAKRKGRNVFIVSDGASGTINNGNPAVRNAREAQVKWELEHGADPDEDWSKKASDNTLDEAIRRIKSHIVVNKGLDPDDVAQRILQLHMGRIFQHIFMVKAFASMIAAKHANAKWVPKLRENVLKHDQHKWNDVEFMGDYAPYIVEQYVGSKWFHTNEGYDKVHERIGRIHRTMSEHHVDHWCPFRKASERNGEPLVPLLMPDYAMAEMCADWMAVSMEKGTTATEWFHRNQGKKWRFTKNQQRFIESILKDEPEFRRRFKSA